MPLIIPGSRNLTQEAFTAYLVGLQQSRFRQDERKRQEEAADAGGSGIGSIAGGVIGGVIGGAAGFSVGAGLGGALGAVVDPPGSRAGVSQAGQIGRGLATAAQGLGQAMMIEQQADLTEGNKRDAFVANLKKVGGAELVDLWNTFSAEQLAANPDMVEADLRNAWHLTQAAEIQAITRRAEQGNALAKAQGEQEVENWKLYQQNRNNPGAVFDWNPFLADEHQGFLLDEKLRDHELRKNQISRGMHAAGKIQAGQDELAFSRKLRRKRPTPISVQQMQQAGKQLQQSQQYYDENVPGSVVSVSSGGAINTYVPPGTVTQDKTNPDLRWGFDTKGNREFHSRRRADGRWYSQGMEFSMEGGTGLYQYDKDGDIKQVPGTGGDDKLDDAIMNNVVFPRIQEGASAKVAIQAGVDAKAAFAEVERQQALKPIESARSSGDVDRILKQVNPEYARAAKILENPTLADREEVEGAANAMSRIIREAIKGIELTPSALEGLNDMVDAMDQVVAEAQTRSQRLEAGRR